MNESDILDELHELRTRVGSLEKDLASAEAVKREHIDNIEDLAEKMLDKIKNDVLSQLEANAIANIHNNIANRYPKDIDTLKDILIKAFQLPAFNVSPVTPPSGMSGVNAMANAIAAAQTKINNNTVTYGSKSISGNVPNMPAIPPPPPPSYNHVNNNKAIPKPVDAKSLEKLIKEYKKIDEDEKRGIKLPKLFRLGKNKKD